jgi:hypothetical protein
MPILRPEILDIFLFGSSYVAMTRARDYLHLIIGEREIRLARGENINAVENPRIGLKFDSCEGYVANNDEGGKGMLTLFKFANDNYARYETLHNLTNGTGKGLQNLLLWRIKEGDPLQLTWDMASNDNCYQLYHPRLETRIGRLTRSNSQYIRQRFPNQNCLQGIRVTSISRLKIPVEGEPGAQFNKYLCESVKQQGYYYIVNCAGYLLPI